MVKFKKKNVILVILSLFEYNNDRHLKFNQHLTIVQNKGKLFIAFFIFKITF